MRDFKLYIYSSQVFKGIPDCFTIALNVLGFRDFELWHGTWTILG
jgi:hypothetical protein